MRALIQELELTACFVHTLCCFRAPFDLHSHAHAHEQLYDEETAYFSFDLPSLDIVLAGKIPGKFPINFGRYMCMLCSCHDVYLLCCAPAMLRSCCALVMHLFLPLPILSALYMHVLQSLCAQRGARAAPRAQCHAQHRLEGLPAGGRRGDGGN